MAMIATIFPLGEKNLNKPTFRAQNPQSMQNQASLIWSVFFQIVS